MRAILLAALFLSLPLTVRATQEPGTEAWLLLRPSSEAHKIMKARCSEEAGEQFYGSMENVTAIYVENPEALSSITGSSDSYGINYTNPPYACLRNGLLAIEFDSASKHIHPAEKNPKEQPFARFDTKTRNHSFVSALSAPVMVRYTKTTSREEEALGVYGRLIEIIEREGSRLLARRRHFVWVNPDPRGAHGGFMCPTLGVGESIPISFLGKAINVKSYTCWRQREEAMKSAPNWRLLEQYRLTSVLDACEALHFGRLSPAK